MTDHDAPTPAELRGVPRSTYGRSHAMPRPNPEPLTATVQVEYSLGGRSARLVCRRCAARTTSIWTAELDAWIEPVLARHDGVRDCSVPEYASDHPGGY